MTHWFERYSLYIALAAAWTAMLGSLYFSEVAGYVPCQLCWYQRILMYPLTLIVAVGILRRDIQLPFYILPFSLLGICVSTYHYLLQKTDLFGGNTVCGAGVPCTGVWINWFGFVTIPFLALTAFMVITVMTVIAMNTEESVLDRTGATQWVQVGGIIGALLIFFAILAVAGRQATVLPDSAIDELAEHGEMSVDGALLYQQICAACHGAELEGVVGLGNALATSDFVAAKSDAELLAFIRTGRDASDPAHTSGISMPAGGGRPDLSDEEILAIVAHLRLVAGNAE